MPAIEPSAAVEGGAPAPVSTASRDWIDVTVRLATSWIGLFTAYVAALILALTKFREFAAALHEMGLPPWSGIALVAAFPLFALVFSTIPSLIEQRRLKRYGEIKVDVRSGYFTLRPRETEAEFERVDNAHQEVLRWVEDTKEPVLYLTGASGTGKSSLLAAWVVPKLSREGHVVIQLRGYEQLFERIRDRILHPGLVWAQPPGKDNDLRSLLDRASQRLGDRRLIIVIDQFEEFLILKEEEQQKAFQQLLSAKVINGLTFLLVYRPEYEGLIQDQPWPRLQLDTNRKVISPFTENAANDFIRKSGLTLNPDLMRAVLREAAEIEQGAVGLIRPVTINLCGLVLSRFSNGLPRKFRGGIIRGFLRESLLLPEVRDVAEKVIPTLVTDNVTKRPRTIAEMAQTTQLAPSAIGTCMRRLGESDRAIVRPLDERQETWEISHDFLVPLLDSIVARRTVSSWRRLRPWLPWAAAAALAVVAVVTPLITRGDPTVELRKQGWAISQTRDIGLVFARNDAIPSESFSILRALPPPYGLDLSLSHNRLTNVSSLQGLKGLTALNLGNTEVSDVSPLQGLKRLTILTLDSTEVTDLSPLQGLTNLTTLDLTGARVTDLSPLRGLKRLTTLQLTGTQVTDLSPLQGLTGLMALRLDSTQVADVSPLQGLTDLAKLDLSDTKVTDLSPLRGLKRLTTLDLSNTKVTDLSRLQGLTGLTTLQLAGTQVTDVSSLQGLTGLTTLYLNVTGVADISALHGLTGLTTLYLGGTKVTDLTALQGLKTLTTLDLRHTKVANVSALQGLTSLTRLNLTETEVTDLAPLQGLKGLTELDLRDTKVTNVSPLQGLKGLKIISR